MSGHQEALVGADKYVLALKELADILVERRDELDKEEIGRLKIEISRKWRLGRVPSNSEIAQVVSDEQVRSLLLSRPSRVASGILTVTVAAKPYPCPPQAKCIYCPGGPAVNTPKSYVKESPSVIQGAKHGYDPREQVESKVKLYSKLGYPSTKIEAIVVGGTFLYYPVEYQYDFIKGVFDGLNSSSSSSLQEAHLINESSTRRCVGLTIETRPDFCKEEHVDLMLDYGVTRVEIGVQTLDDEVLEYVKRGHSVEDAVEAIRISRDAGLKIGVHMMPGLPRSSVEKDLESFRRLFYDEGFKPDTLKIYPTLVLESAPMYWLYKRGLYKPYSFREVVELLVRVKSIVPPWLRIMRIQREIPPNAIIDGPKLGNLRQVVLEELRKRGLWCRCIRCREVGRNSLTPEELTRFKLVKRVYDASGGKEYFLSLEDERERVAGFVRVRLPSGRAHRPEVKNMPSVIVRELRVYGLVVDVGKRSATGWQHRGLGRRLMSEVERLAFEELGVKKVVVISAVGTRGYYRKMGYDREGPYMTKVLSEKNLVY